MANVETPNIDETMEWYESLAVEDNGFDYSKYGINNIEDLKGFYLK